MRLLIHHETQKYGLHLKITRVFYKLLVASLKGQDLINLVACLVSLVLTWMKYTPFFKPETSRVMG